MGGKKELAQRERRGQKYLLTLLLLLVLVPASVLTATAQGTTAINCTDCHGTNVVSKHHQADDPNSAFSRGECTTCHVGVTTSGDCSQCHNFGGLQNNHHQTEPALAGNCAACHTGVGELANCLSCHEGKVRTRHHEIAASGLACNSCHANIVDSSNCTNCHDRSNGAVQKKHHALVGAQNNLDCTSCHDQILQITNCQTCHAPGTKRDQHHAAAATQNIDCSQCHTSFPAGTAGSGCANCHQAGNNRDFHHGTVAPSKGLDCSQCHTSFPAGTVGSGCVNCHQAGNNRDFHHGTVAPTKSLNCSSCHTQIVQNADSCRSCHDFKAANIHHTSAVPGQLGMDCYSCHDLVNVGGAYYFLKPSIAQCTDCHTNVVGTASIPETHHATPPAIAGNCTSCHAGVQQGLSCSDCHNSGAGTTAERHHNTVAPGQNLDCSYCHTGIPADLSCSDCHTSATGTAAERHHNTVAPGQNLDCTYCHTGADTVFQGCEACHAAKIAEPNPIPTLHHTMTIAGTTGQCSACHTGIDPASLDCAICHLAPGMQPINERHHATQTAQLGQCTACHTGAEAELLNCAACHQNRNHHGQPQAQPGPTQDCTFCHATVQVAGDGCSACHTAPIPQLHHEGPNSPLARLGGNCGACHQSVSDPSVCATCHTSSPHHSTTFAQTGDCAHCHKVPAWAQDRPKQAACRECHGQYQHDKGGPIQNYGACAACHNQDPFHAAPGRPVGYTVMVGGKGKFAMFWNQYTNGGKKEVRKDVKPNGESLKDEGGRKWSQPSLSFNKVQIEHNGRTYTVPSFDQASSGGGAASGNLAAGQSASASRQRSGYEASKAVDGNASSRWWTTDKESEWLRVNLNGSYTISKVVINWHNYFAKEYQVQVSTDGSKWSTVREQKEGRGGREEITFSSRSARYVRIYCNKADNDRGFSIYELEVYE